LPSQWDSASRSVPTAYSRTFAVLMSQQTSCTVGLRYVWQNTGKIK
jgi:hypothetical protein